MPRDSGGHRALAERGTGLLEHLLPCNGLAIPIFVRGSWQELLRGDDGANHPTMPDCGTSLLLIYNYRRTHPHRDPDDRACSSEPN